MPIYVIKEVQYARIDANGQKNISISIKDVDMYRFHEDYARQLAGIRTERKAEQDIYK